VSQDIAPVPVRPLGAVLVEMRVVSLEQLGDALQRASSLHRRLGDTWSR